MLLMRRFFAFLAPYDCLVCGRQGELLCPPCLARIPPPSNQRPPPPPMERLWVATDYAGVVKQLIHAYKFERARDVVGCLARLLDRTLPALADETIITYVPTATSRIRERGYDHARVLAEAFACRRGLVAQSLLQRHGQNRQVGADRRDRLRQAAVYGPKPGLSLKGRPVLLMDDIVTSGATLSAAAQALKVMGVVQVYGLVVAQK